MRNILFNVGTIVPRSEGPRMRRIKMRKKSFLLILLTCFLIILCGSAIAEKKSGYCGVNVRWEYNGFGLLTISGNGQMSDYSYFTAPWESEKLLIFQIVINNGVSSIGDYAFYNMSFVNSITIPDSVTRIGSHAFSHCSGLWKITLPPKLIFVA